MLGRQPSFSFYGSLASLLLLVVLVSAQSTGSCPQGQVRMATSIPIDLPVPAYATLSTYQAWLSAIMNAKKSIDIGCYYMTLTDGTGFPSGQGGAQGMMVYKALVTAAQERGVKIRIVQQLPSARMPAYDTGNLTAIGAAEVRSIDFANVDGYGKLGGILHTKLMVVDGKDAYVGSANMDWRSLTQVKEVGAMVTDCPVYASDIEKVFEQYWIAAAATSLPSWPSTVNSDFNYAVPMTIGSSSTPVYAAVSPDTFVSTGRDSETSAIMHAITDAKKYVKFAVMDYAPTTWYSPMPLYWANVDTYLRTAAFSGAKVQLLFSIWNHTNPTQLQFWRSLGQLKNIEVKSYKIPDSPFGPPAPFSRVSHSKYVVTDKQAYVTTSNCVGDYYLYTAGVSVNVMDPTSQFVTDLNSMFDADWNSPFAGPVPDSLPRKGGK